MLRLGSGAGGAFYRDIGSHFDANALVREVPRPRSAYRSTVVHQDEDCKLCCDGSRCWEGVVDESVLKVQFVDGEAKGRAGRNSAQDQGGRRRRKDLDFGQGKRRWCSWGLFPVPWVGGGEAVPWRSPVENRSRYCLEQMGLSVISAPSRWVQATSRWRRKAYRWVKRVRKMTERKRKAACTGDAAALML